MRCPELVRGVHASSARSGRMRSLNQLISVAADLNISPFAVLHIGGRSAPSAATSHADDLLLANPARFHAAFGPPGTGASGRSKLTFRDQTGAVAEVVCARLMRAWDGCRSGNRPLATNGTAGLALC